MVLYNKKSLIRDVEWPARDMEHWFTDGFGPASFFREFLFIVPSVLSEDAQTLKPCAVSGQDDPNGFLEYFEFISLVFGNQVRKCSRST